MKVGSRAEGVVDRPPAASSPTCTWKAPVTLPVVPVSFLPPPPPGKQVLQRTAGDTLWVLTVGHVVSCSGYRHHMHASHITFTSSREAG